MQIIRSSIRPADMASEQVIGAPTCRMRRGGIWMHTNTILIDSLHAHTAPACNRGQSVDMQMIRAAISPVGSCLRMCHAQGRAAFCMPCSAAPDSSL